MAITQAACSSFKAELMLGVHDFRVGGDTFMLALYVASANIDANTTSYNPAGEVVGVNYPAGGVALTNNGVTTAPNTASAGGAFTDFADITIPTTTLTARGALIYNATPSRPDNSGATLINPAVCALDFGSDKSSTLGDFSIIFPAPAITTAILRIT